jgi:aminoglycoside 6-adenylyltransferase
VRCICTAPGSRTNPNAPKDIFQDYDIVSVDKNDHSIGIDMDFAPSYGYLMLFTDGNRIDLHIETKESMLEGYVSDKLTVPLLDKDNCLPNISAPTDNDYHVKKPTEQLYLSCCNDFWWCLQNVAKGIWRDELPYTKQMFEHVIRPGLDEMISWWVGTKNGFQVSIGKMGKYLKTYLPESYWEMYKETYSDSNYENMWNSVFTACELFRVLAKDVAEYFQYTYEVKDDTNMTNYLEY